MRCCAKSLAIFPQRYNSAYVSFTSPSHLPQAAEVWLSDRFQKSSLEKAVTENLMLKAKLELKDQCIEIKYPRREGDIRGHALKRSSARLATLLILA